MTKVPGYLRHSSGQARTLINGKIFYLGKYNSKISKQRYDKLIAEYLGSNRSSVFGIEAEKMTMAHLMLAYMEHAKTYFGESDTSELHRIKYALRPVNKLYADLAVEELHPVHFKAIRQIFIGEDLARSFINAQMKRILRMIKWGAAEGLYPAAIHDTLKKIPSLRFGHTEAREAEPVKPVSEEKVEATLPHCSPVVADMIRVQLLIGSRPSEVCALTPGMIDRSQPVWEARLLKHKTAYRNKARILYIGPRAQAILAPYLLRGEDERLFQPIEAMKRLRENKERQTPENQGNRPGYSKRVREGRQAKRKAGDAYNARSYAKAISYACMKAFPESENATPEERKAWRAAEWWSPNQLRHQAATEITKQFGLEKARVVLGHATIQTTQIYAEIDRENAIEVATKVG